ncbi:MAG TPA: PSD1 and planctomycete cytochrome C domain-containing protein [Candidatus Limnocylindria bacterium]|nr:PSD1 and planctomycete cytochrome C domain-containing protein [Candidatus Limnocylindria bacterium]
MPIPPIFPSTMPRRLYLACAIVIGHWMADAATPDYVREVRPILERSCYSCHGPEKQKNGYRLDVRDTAIKGGDSGVAAIVPHDSKHSRLIRLVSGEDEETPMPPVSSKGPRPTPAEIETLRAWIDAGPYWPDELANSPGDGKAHWSLRPLIKPALPIKQGHPVDAFIRAKLAQKNLTPSPPADRRTLIRRVYYDLTGLPPSPAEVMAFERDRDPRAYEKLVDRLLASPRYGERWARHWLDTIHFADSHGYEHDIGRMNAWRFRDYVIDTFNRDTPWPQFIREQLAADVFYPDQPELTRALGYLGAGTFDMSTYATAPVTFEYLDRDDLVTQTMSAFVSTTANCARCHANKFDPISQEDYYALQADFAGILKGDIEYHTDLALNRERRRWKTLAAAVDRADPAVLLAPENAPLASAWLEKHRGGVHWQALSGTSLSSEGTVFTYEADGVVLAGGPRPERDTYTITFTNPPSKITAIRLNVLARDALPKHGPGRQDNGNLHLTEFEARLLEPGQTNARPVKIRQATADFNQDDWGIGRALDGDLKTAWGIYPSVGRSHHAVFECAETLELVPGTRLEIVLKQLHGGGHLIGAFSLSTTQDPAADAVAMPLEIETALAVAAAERTEKQRTDLAAYALKPVAAAALEKLPAPLIVYGAGTSVDVLSGDPPKTGRFLTGPKVVNVLYRGEFDKPRAVANPGALSALQHLPSRFILADSQNEGLRRAALADWLADHDNVLTWRSIVNRVWHYHFGRGLCDTPSDFGKMGGTPSHPELIDWLAVWFRDEAHGSLKELHRLVVTSETYKQSSQTREEAASVDGENRLLWRQNRQRLDADSYRDFTLAVSGALSLQMGGPAVQNFKQSKGPQNTPNLDYTAYDWSRPDAARRSVYRFVWRGIADPFMESLDFPDLGLLAPVRGFSASSLQALTLYNNDFVLHQSEVLARRLEREAKTVDTQAALGVRLVWLREPQPAEQIEFSAFAHRHGMAALCRLLFNSNEYLFVN